MQPPDNKVLTEIIIAIKDFVILHTIRAYQSKADSHCEQLHVCMHIISVYE